MITTNKLAKIIYLFGFCLITIAFLYSFLFEPIWAKHCERFADKKITEKEDALAKIEQTFQERKAYGKYDFLQEQENPYKNIFNNVEFNTDFTVNTTNFITESSIRNDIRNELYPNVDFTEKRLNIVKKCTIFF